MAQGVQPRVREATPCPRPNHCALLPLLPTRSTHPARAAREPGSAAPPPPTLSRWCEPLLEVRTPWRCWLGASARRSAAARRHERAARPRASRCVDTSAGPGTPPAKSEPCAACVQTQRGTLLMLGPGHELSGAVRLLASDRSCCSRCQSAARLQRPHERSTVPQVASAYAAREGGVPHPCTDVTGVWHGSACGVSMRTLSPCCPSQRTVQPVLRRQHCTACARVSLWVCGTVTLRAAHCANTCVPRGPHTHACTRACQCRSCRSCEDPERVAYCSALSKLGTLAATEQHHMHATAQSTCARRDHTTPRARACLRASKRHCKSAPPASGAAETMSA